MERRGIGPAGIPDTETGLGSNSQGRGIVVIVGLAAIALLGVIDHVTGREVGVSITYLAPIGVVAWLAGR